MKKKIINKDFFYKIILPTLLAFSIFTILIFAVIIPSIKSYMLNGKREMIRELTNSAWSVLDEFEKEVADSMLSRDEAQKEAITRIENMRYGEQRKDYFWITDKHPTMIMHPYRKDLNNTDLSAYTDPAGKRLFVEFVNMVEQCGQGYVDYMWQWKDDSTQIVAKLSFVKGFGPWGWVVGTGIYIEDVNDEISSLTANLFYISLGILFILGFNLLFINRQSLLIENRRNEAEKGLRESEAKYRALVEASTDGLVMMLDNTYIYSNQALLHLLGYKNDSLENIDLNSILCDPKTEDIPGHHYFKKLLDGQPPLDQFQAKLKRKDGSLLDVILYTSKIELGQKEGFSIIVKDVSTHKQIEEELDLNKEKYLSLANSIKIGVIRSIFDSKGKIVEANESAANILGYDDKEAIKDINLFDLFYTKTDRKRFHKKLAEEGSIKDSIIRIKNKSGSTVMISVSAVLVKNMNNEAQYFDTTIDDITDKVKHEEQRENLIAELHTSLRFLNQPLALFVKHLVTCAMYDSIQAAAQTMSKQNYSAALIKADSGEFIGLVTDQNLRQRVLAEGKEPQNAVFEVMTSPLPVIARNALVFEALLSMKQSASSHLAVKNIDGEITGIISSEELIAVQQHSTAYLRREIEMSTSVDELIIVHEKLPVLVKVLIDSGTQSQIISRTITSIFEAISRKLISFAISELGKPPIEFAFVAMGSVGRKEQTLISDQDNAIIYQDIPLEKEAKVHKYFHDLATKVCDWLNDCGYVYCIGEAMAKNPKWCQPLSQWKEYFRSWIIHSDPQDLIDLSIFFDFRCIYGNKDLTDKLRQHLFKIANGQAAFFQHLAKNCLMHKPPVGLLGKIVVQSKGEHQETFDIKTAIMPLSDYSRIYALKNSISHCNSLQRLDVLLEKGIINKASYEELQQAYNFLMQLRYKHQSQQIMENLAADNYINPNSLTQIEQKTLKNIFSQIISVQKRLNYDFSGDAIWQS